MFLLFHVCLGNLLRNPPSNTDSQPMVGVGPLNTTRHDRRHKEAGSVKPVARRTGLDGIIRGINALYEMWFKIVCPQTSNNKK